MAPAQRDEDRLGSVSGRVLNSLTGAAVGEVHLRLSSSDNARSSSVESAPDGSFRFRMIEPGRYFLFLECDGYVSMWHGGSVHRQPLLVEAGRELSRVEIRLTPTGTISGRIEDEAGRPVANASIRLLTRWVSEGRLTWRSSDGTCSLTNDRGQYRCFFVEPGRKLVAVRTSNYADSSFLTAPSSSVAARVVRPRAPVQTYYPGVLSRDDAVPVDVLPGQEQAGIDFRLLRVPVYKVSGRVLDEVTGKPPGEMARTHMGSAGDELVSFHDFASDYQTGAFEFRMVPPGRYELRASAGNRHTKTIVDVDKEDLPGLVLLLKAGVRVRGRIVVPPQIGCERSKDGVSRLSLALTATDRYHSYSVKVEVNEVFELADVSPGEYRLRIWGFPDHCILETASSRADVFTPEIVVPPGGISDLEVRLIAAATVTGVVRNEDGKPVEGARVVCVVKDEATGAALSGCEPSVTDQTGGFELKPLAPGSVRIVALRSFDPNKPLPAGILSRATELKLVEGGKQSADLEVQTAEQ